MKAACIVAMKLSATLFALSSLLLAGPAYADAVRTDVSSPGGRNVTALDRHPGGGLGGYYAIELSQPLDGRPSQFDLHHLILQTSTQLHERLLFNAEVEFEHGGIINTGLNDGELEIEQCWADYRISEALGLRAGVVLIPFGIVNVLHDADIRETTTRPLMANVVIPTTWFEPGVGLHGLVYPFGDATLTYEGYVVQGLSDAISPTTGLRTARPSLGKDNNGNKAVTGRVALSPWLGFELAASGYYGAYDPAGTQHVGLVGADASYTFGPAQLLAEYARVGTDGGTAGANAIPTGMDGLYVEGRYRFFPAFLDGTWLGQGGGFDHALFTLVARAGYADTNHAAFDASDRNELLLGLNYRPIPNFAVKLEGQRQNQPAVGLTTDTLWTSLAVGF